MATRKFSSISVETTLASTIGATGTTMTVATGTGSALINGAGFVNGDQFTVAIDPDTTSEEIVFITANSGDSFTIERAKAGTSGISHSAGATVKHVLTSDDLNWFESNTSPLTSMGFSGSSSGTTTVQASAVASGTLTLPAATDTLVGKATTDTLTNKTLTAPKIANNGFIADANGNEQIIFTTTASAVNEVTLANAATGGTPTITASGGDTNVSLNLVAKGTGTVQAGGVQVSTISGTETLTNKTLTSPTVNTPTINDARQNITLNAQTGTTYTPVLTDNGRLVTLSNASAITLTVPTNASVAYATGAIINIQQIGAGQVTVAGDTGVTVNGTGTKTRAQWSAASLIKTATDTWTLIGDLE
jgi:hypothetical protein